MISHVGRAYQKWFYVNYHIYSLKVKLVYSFYIAVLVLSKYILIILFGYGEFTVYEYLIRVLG